MNSVNRVCARRLDVNESGSFDLSLGWLLRAWRSSLAGHLAVSVQSDRERQDARRRRSDKLECDVASAVGVGFVDAHRESYTHETKH